MFSIVLEIKLVLYIYACKINVVSLKCLIIMVTSDCEWIQSAKELARTRKLPPDEVLCLYGQVAQCMDGVCAMIEQRKGGRWGRNQETKFYARLLKRKKMRG